MLVYSANNYHKDRIAIIENNPDKLGLVFTPRDYRANYKSRYFFDNGAFSAYIKGVSWNVDMFLQGFKRFGQNADFVVLPDIVAGGKQSLKRSQLWLEFLPEGNYYLAVQDGMTVNVNTKGVKGLFVGGSMEWKEKTAGDWIKYAHYKGIKCHIGRIGTLRRVLWAEKLGADSIDSSNFARHEGNWKELLGWLFNRNKDLLNLSG